MRTQTEIYYQLIEYLELGMNMGFFSEEECNEIDKLETEYELQIVKSS